MLSYSDIVDDDDVKTTISDSIGGKQSNKEAGEINSERRALVMSR